MGTRADIAERLEEPMAAANVEIVTTVEELAELDPERAGVVQIIRRKVAPGAAYSAFVMEFDLWVIDPHYDPAAVEDSLDALADAVIEALQPIPWLVWSAADREMHPSGYHAYRLTIETRGNSSS